MERAGPDRAGNNERRQHGHSSPCFHGCADRFVGRKGQENMEPLRIYAALAKRALQSRAGARSMFPHNPMRAPYPGIINCCGRIAADQHQLIVCDWPMFNRGFSNSTFDETEFRYSAEDAMCGLLCVGDGHVDCYLRMALAKNGQMLWKPIVCNCLTGDEGEPASFEEAEFREYPFRARRTAKYGLGFGEENTPCVGQLDSPPNAMEKRNSILHFQCRNGRTCRRLGDVEGCRRLCHMFPVGDSDKNM